MRQDNESKLEKIRVTVDEKLQTTLENRLGESFKLVSERLELVHKGLGEMQSLASGVGDLKRVLTNVRSRGTFGEVQLAALLEQVLTPAQYECNCATVPGSSERVEFAIRLPGREDEEGVVRLPIDAKFPQEDYLRLLDAYDAGDAAALETARKALRVRLLNEAATIRAKYVSPPHTTDFALLFVPTEGLYAEVLRMGGVAETMQTEQHVILVGPTTLYAVLSSLQMGFRTLAIEKRSSEVWKILAAVKTEFGKFGESLSVVSKKLQEASNKIEDSAKRSRAVERTLRNVEALPEPEAVGLLGDEDGGGSSSV
jgi:DNA recombination protein RmuC